MSVHTCVASRDELVEAVLDTICAEAVREPTDRLPGDWREGLHVVADVTRQMYQLHPCALHVVTARPSLGPDAIGTAQVGALFRNR